MPIFCSGDGSPANRRIGRLSHGPGSAGAGHTPSTRPPSTATSTLCNAASCNPQIATRGCPSFVRGRRTTAPLSTASSKSAISLPPISGSPSKTSSACNKISESAVPASPGHNRAAPASSGVVHNASATPINRRNAAAGSLRSAKAAGRNIASKRSKNTTSAESFSSFSRNFTSSNPGPGRGPRSAYFSKPRACSRQTSGGNPAAANGCFSSASKGNGANSLTTARASSRSKIAGGVCASGSPALSSAVMPKRFNAAVTRAARPRSGVTSAAVRPGTSSASRKIIAIAVAFCASSGASNRLNPASCSSTFSCHTPRQAEGSNARENTRLRPSGTRESGAGSRTTSSRRAPISPSSRAIPPCAWLSSSASQASSLSSES